MEKTLAEVTCQGFDDSVLLPPGSVLTGSREMYKVFTPFKNAFIRRLQEALPECVAAPKVRAGGPIAAASEVKIDYPQTPFDSELFAADEKSAIARLRGFCQQKAADYEQQRDPSRHRGDQPTVAVPGRWARSHRASACTVCGSSSRGRWMAKPDRYGSTSLSGASFYRHLMVYYPNLCKGRPFIDWTDNVAWLDDKSALQSWQRGQTGFPIGRRRDASA